MAKNKHIAHSSSTKIGDGKCSSCGKEINGLFMITDYYDMKSRGNEGDHRTVRCEACINPNDKVYLKYLKEQELAEKKRKEEKERNEKDPLRFAKIVANEPTYETEYDGRTYEMCFYCDANIGEGEKHHPDCAYLEAKERIKACSTTGPTDPV